MSLIGSLGILIGVAAIIYFSVKGINIIIAAPMATLIVVLFNRMDVVTALLGPGKNDFMGALSNYIMSYFAIFLLGSILAKFMEVSGATTSIADFILKKVGYENPFRVMVAIFIVSLVLTYGGISLFVVMFAVLPLVTLIVIAISGSTFGNEFVKKNIIYVALIVSILLAVGLFYTFIPNKIATLSLGAIGPIFATASAVAFGAVVMVAPGFTFFSDLILNIPGSPMISLTVLTGSMSAITGSSSGALGIVMPNFAQHYLDTGLHPELIHRVAAIASNILTVVPQSGVLLTFLSLAGLNHKNGFKQTFTTVAVGTSIAIVIVILLGSIMY